MKCRTKENGSAKVDAPLLNKQIIETTVDGHLSKFRLSKLNGTEIEWSKFNGFISEPSELNDTKIERLKLNSS